MAEHIPHPYPARAVWGSYGQPGNTWMLCLNRYQRDNLLQLLNVCGMPEGNPLAHPSFNCNTGDWLGEIVFALTKKAWDPEGAFDYTACVIDKYDLPNGLPAWLKVPPSVPEAEIET